MTALEIHRSEVRHILALRADKKADADRYLNLIEARRGKVAADKLRDEYLEQWQAGNKGEKGEWK